jgi:hypothetical protein
MTSLLGRNLRRSLCRRPRLPPLPSPLLHRPTSPRSIAQSRPHFLCTLPTRTSHSRRSASIRAQVLFVPTHDLLSPYATGFCNTSCFLRACKLLGSLSMFRLGLAHDTLSYAASLLPSPVRVVGVLWAALDGYRVVGHNSTVPRSSSSSSVRISCPPSLAGMPSVLVL